MSLISPDVHVFPDLVATSHALSNALARQINDVVERRKCCTLVLAGGSTPQLLYECLATDYADAMSWEHVHVFWGDERYVPLSDTSNNARMAHETLLDRIPVPDENIHPMPTDLNNPEAAAQVYEKTLRGFFDGAWPAFDLMLLGLGADGHTASLFPGAKALEEKERWVVSVENPAVTPPRRLSLTLPALNHATRVHFLVAGARKAEAVARALADPSEPERCPASAVRPAHGTLTWWLDAEAASRIVKEK